MLSKGWTEPGRLAIPLQTFRHLALYWSSLRVFSPSVQPETFSSSPASFSGYSSSVGSSIFDQQLLRAVAWLRQCSNSAAILRCCTAELSAFLRPFLPTPPQIPGCRFDSGQVCRVSRGSISAVFQALLEHLCKRLSPTPLRNLSSPVQNRHCYFHTVAVCILHNYEVGHR